MMGAETKSRILNRLSRPGAPSLRDTLQSKPLLFQPSKNKKRKKGQVCAPSSSTLSFLPWVLQVFTDGREPVSCPGSWSCLFKMVQTPKTSFPRHRAVTAQDRTFELCRVQGPEAMPRFEEMSDAAPGCVPGRGLTREMRVCPGHAVTSRVGRAGPLGRLLSVQRTQASVRSLLLNTCEDTEVLIRGGGLSPASL